MQNNLVNGIAILNHNLQIVFFNNDALKIFGYTFEEIDGKQIQTLFISKNKITDKLTEYQKILSNSENGKEAVQINAKGVTKNGERVPLTLLIDSFKNRDSCHYVAHFSNPLSKALREKNSINSENIIDSVFEVVDFGLSIHTLDYEIIYQNKMLRDKYSGLGEKCYLVYGEKNSICPNCVVAKAFVDGKSHVAIKTVRLKDNTEEHWEVTAIPIRDGNGNLISALEITKNVTEYKAIERKLEKKQNEIETILDSVPALIFFKDKENKFVKVNKTFSDSANLPKELIEKKSAFDIAHDRNIAEQYWHDDIEVIDTGIPKKNIIEQFITDKTRWYQTDKIPFLNEEGKIDGVIGFSVEITERVEAESALRQSEEKFRSSFHNASIGMVITDLAGKFVEVNNSFCNMLGFSSNELLEKSFQDITFPDDLDEDLQNIKNLNSGKIESFKIEKRYIKKDGNIIWVVLNASIIRSADKAPQNYIAQIEDISLQKKAENELKLSYEKLEEKINNRTEKLKKAKEEAEQATTLKDKFVSIVAHDLTTPLLAFQGFIRLFKEINFGNTEIKGLDFLDSAFRSSQDAVRLIQDLLNISRLKGIKIVPKNLFLDAHFLGVKAYLAFDDRAKQKGINLINNIPEGSRIFADFTLIYQVIYNLVSNAVKFSSKGDTITLSIRQEEITKIAVSDTGTGIHPKILENIFKYDVKTTTKGTDGEKGSGLALPLAKEIMEAHGGTLYAESLYGNGSSFYAELPSVTPRVLIVDDEPLFRMEQKIHLKKLALEIYEASNGDEALKIIETLKPHLIITDVRMPIVDGLELLEKVKTNPDLNHIPVIVVSGDPGMTIREKVFKGGAQDFVAKPFEPDELVPRVKRFIFY